MRHVKGNIPSPPAAPAPARPPRTHSSAAGRPRPAPAPARGGGENIAQNIDQNILQEKVQNKFGPCSQHEGQGTPCLAVPSLPHAAPAAAERAAGDVSIDSMPKLRASACPASTSASASHNTTRPPHQASRRMYTQHTQASEPRKGLPPPRPRPRQKTITVLHIREGQPPACPCRPYLQPLLQLLSGEPALPQQRSDAGGSRHHQLPRRGRLGGAREAGGCSACASSLGRGWGSWGLLSAVWSNQER